MSKIHAKYYSLTLLRDHPHYSFKNLEQASVEELLEYAEHGTNGDALEPIKKRAELLLLQLPKYNFCFNKLLEKFIFYVKNGNGNAGFVTLKIIIKHFDSAFFRFIFKKKNHNKKEEVFGRYIDSDRHLAYYFFGPHHMGSRKKIEQKDIRLNYLTNIFYQKDIYETSGLLTLILVEFYSKQLNHEILQRIYENQGAHTYDKFHKIKERVFTEIPHIIKDKDLMDLYYIFNISLSHPSTTIYYPNQDSYDLDRKLCETIVAPLLKERMQSKNYREFEKLTSQYEIPDAFEAF